MRAELVVPERLSRRADDPVALRQQAGLGEVEQAGQELAPCEIARRSEQDDDVIVGLLIAVPHRGAQSAQGSERYAAAD
jgi:hypothetical protein